MGIGRCDAGAIELRGRERQLVALARHTHLPRPLHIEPLALAPGARERAVDVDVDADLGAVGRELVGWHHVIDQRLDESRLVEVQELVALGRRLGGGFLRLRARSWNGGCGGRGWPPPPARRFFEITAAAALRRHVLLPASGLDLMVSEVVSCVCQNAPFPVAAARLSMQGLLRPISKVAMVCRRLRGCTVVPNSLTGPRDGSPAWCIMAAVNRMLAPRRGVISASVAPGLAGRRFLRLLGSCDRLRG